MTTYSNKVYLTGFDLERVIDLKNALQHLMRGIGKEPLRRLLRDVNEGRPTVVYASNDYQDAEEIADLLRRVGATVRISA